MVLRLWGRDHRHNCVQFNYLNECYWPQHAIHQPIRGQCWDNIDQWEASDVMTRVPGGITDNVLTVFVSGGARAGRGQSPELSWLMLHTAVIDKTFKLSDSEAQDAHYVEPRQSSEYSMAQLVVDRTNVLFRHPRLMQMFRANKTPQISVLTNCRQ